MKTSAKIQQEIDEIIRQKQESDRLLKSKEITLKKNLSFCKKADEKIATLKQYQRYIETSPRPEFILSEINRIEAKLKSIERGFGGYIKANSKTGTPQPLFIKELRKTYDKLMDVKKLNAQLETLTYINS